MPELIVNLGKRRNYACQLCTFSTIDRAKALEHFEQHKIEMLFDEVKHKHLASLENDLDDLVGYY